MTCTRRCGWSWWCLTLHKEICSIPVAERIAYCKKLIEKERRIQQRASSICTNIFKPVKNRLYELVHGEEAEA